MRQIKFRAKPTDGSTGWVQGFYLQDLQNGQIRHYIFNCPARIEISPETLGQFSGFADDNKEEIWEGDIVKFGAQYGSVSEVKYIIKNGGYLVKDKWGDWQWLYDIAASTNCIVIGNIHDNPDLLKQTNAHFLTK